MYWENSGISNQVFEEICSLAKKYDISKVILFGSRARGDFKEKSDIDIATSGGDFTNFSFDVQNLTNTLLEYDIIDLDGCVQKELLNEIKKDGKILYEKI